MSCRIGSHETFDPEPSLLAAQLVWGKCHDEITNDKHKKVNSHPEHPSTHTSTISVISHFEHPLVMISRSSVRCGRCRADGGIEEWYNIYSVFGPKNYVQRTNRDNNWRQLQLQWRKTVNSRYKPCHTASVGISRFLPFGSYPLPIALSLFLYLEA